MFQRKRPTEQHAEAAASLIAQHTQIRGEVAFDGTLYLEGNVEGVVHANGTHALLTLGPHGVVHGDIRVPSAVIHGEVRGNIHIENALELASTARIIGDVYYRSIKVAEGAHVNGRLCHQTAPSTEAPAMLHSESTPPPAALSANHENASDTPDTMITDSASAPEHASNESRHDRQRRRAAK